MKPAPQQPDNYAADRSPVYRALWEESEVNSPEVFQAASDPPPADVQKTMNRCREVLLLHREQNTLRGPDGKHSAEVLKALGDAGYWGLLVERDYGGSGCGLRHFLPFLTQAAVIDAPIAGLAAVHGCIGAVDPLQTFGNLSQAWTWLPDLASGVRLSAFASTEPGAGSDLRAIEMTAKRTTDGFEISGRKAFITNLAPGRTIGLLCKLEGQAAVFIATLPDAENEHFRLIPNPLHPLKHTLNSGMQLSNFAVDAASLLESRPGKYGRSIIFHGLNRGRAAICALAAGHLRVLLAGMIAWARHRTVQGKKLAELELIQSRCGQVAALIVGCDAMAAWCGSLLDDRFRGELECIIAKVFASEAVKHAAFNLALPTHGGRFFLQGHPAGDMAYDYLAPCIYEGENDLLRLALVQALTKSKNAGAKFNDDWQPVRDLLASSSETQPEMLQVSRQIESLTISAVLQAARPLQATELQPAIELLRSQLRGETLNHARARSQIELGRRMIEHDFLDLADALPFMNPLAD